jgi:hypothetical protein
VVWVVGLRWCGLLVHGWDREKVMDNRRLMEVVDKGWCQGKVSRSDGGSLGV